MKRIPLLVYLLTLPLFIGGFTLDNATVPKADILSGGPPKDGIPALLTPTFVDAASADFLKPQDAVIGVVVSGHPKAYPLKILNWHEVVNDTAGDSPFVVTF